MENYYLLDYLKKNHPDLGDKIDLLKFELDQRIYYFGHHFKHPREMSFSPEQAFSRRIKLFFKDIYLFYLAARTPKKSDNKKIIISNAYFSFNDRLSGSGFNVLRPMHSLARGKSVVGNLRILKEFTSINRQIRNDNFNELLSSNFLNKVDS